MCSCSGDSFEFGEWALKIPLRAQISDSEVDGAPKQELQEAWAAGAERKNVAAGQGAPTILVRNDENNGRAEEEAGCEIGKWQPLSLHV